MSDATDTPQPPEPVPEFAPAPAPAPACAEVKSVPAPAAPRPPEPGELSAIDVICATFAERGVLRQLLLTFVLWFLTMWIPYYNIGTTIGLVSAVADVAKGRPVSPIDIFAPEHRRRIVPFCITLGLSLAAGLGLVLFFWLLAGQFRALVAFFPGNAAEQIARGGFLHDLFLLIFLPAPLLLGATLSLALPILCDVGAPGIRALSLSRRITAGDLPAVIILELLPALLALVLARVLFWWGASFLSILVLEGVLAVFTLSLFGHLYRELRPRLPKDVLEGEEDRE